MPETTSETTTAVIYAEGLGAHPAQEFQPLPDLSVGYMTGRCVTPEYQAEATGALRDFLLRGPYLLRRAVLVPVPLGLPILTWDLATGTWTDT